MRKTQILTVFILLFSMFFAFEASAAEQEDVDLSKVENVYVYNIENDKVLYSKNSSDRVYPASTVKVMTGVIALEHYKGDYSKKITVTKDSLGGFKGKSTQLKSGEEVTVENLLYAVICGGYNDAANVLAYEIAGSHEAFVEMMNEKAKELGMNNTNYANAYGYSDTDMYSTAEDTAILAKYAYNINDYMKMANTVRYVMDSTNKTKTRYVYNSNYLIATNVETKYKNAEVMGMNAGSTVEGGHVLVTTVIRNGMTNIYVLMGAQYDEENIYSYIASKDLINWSYENFAYRKIVDRSEMVCEIEVKLSSQVDYVVLLPDQTIEVYLPTSVDIQKDIERKIELYDKKPEAPLRAGHIAGEMTLIYEGEEIGKVNLITKNNVDRNGFLYILARIETLTKSSKFKIAIWVVVIVLILYGLMIIYRRRRFSRQKYKYNRYRRK